MDYKIKEETLSGIADAIRSKSGKTGAILTSDFAENINDIDTIKPEEKANIVLNFASGDMTVTPASGKVFSEVSIPKPESLVPENIAEGIDIAGIVGTQPTYEVLQNVPIDLDFSGGNQKITVSEGQAVESAIIQKPENLVPENIAEGIDIAGIIGTLTAGGGGGNIKAAWGTFTGARGTSKVITHGLGVIPDFAVVFQQNASGTVAANDYLILINYSQKFKSAAGITLVGQGCYKTSSSYSSAQFQGTIEKDGSGYFLNSATTETFTVDPRLTTGRGYAWVAVGGLT